MSPLSQAQIDAINQQLDQSDLARQRLNVVAPGKEVHVETIPLDTAQSRQSPFEVGFEFKGFRIKSATDASTSISVLFDSKDVSQEASPYFKGDVFQSQYLHRCFLFWTAQPGKSVVIEFYKSSVSLPGTLQANVLQVQSAVTTDNALSLTGASSAIVAQNLNRKNLWLACPSTNTDSVYIGDLNVANAGGGGGTKIGIPIPPGGVMQLSNTAQFFGVVGSGTQLLFVMEET